MSLEPTFSLTPRSSYYYAPGTECWITCWGTYLWAADYPLRHSFDAQHANDELLYYGRVAGNPTLDYRQSNNRWQVPCVDLYATLSDYGTNKELALIFGFDALSDSRLLIYSYQGQLADVTLVAGDHQFLIEVEDLGYSLRLWFIHSQLDGSTSGGTWLFRGITGYVI